MNKIRHTLTYYYQSFSRKIVSVLLLAGTATVLLATPVLAVATPYGCGAYNSGTYNGTTNCSGSSSSSSSSSGGSAPNTGGGVYTPTTAGTNQYWYNWAGLAGGIVLIALGIIVFYYWVLPKHLHHDD